MDPPVSTPTTELHAWCLNRLGVAALAGGPAISLDFNDFVSELQLWLKGKAQQDAVLESTEARQRALDLAAKLPKDLSSSTYGTNAWWGRLIASPGMNIASREPSAAADVNIEASLQAYRWSVGANVVLPPHERDPHIGCRLATPLHRLEPPGHAVRLE